ncbi:hypothetical protein L249_4271 [Ophiocordyceps polyrhachis-furcata BCC 54312]|uniref:Uncharacterized protein n=1 Tax=Ophiocordyceps polyrhachis-furcata BCC 54312 TaxID=1330021 RepID=A0A367L7P1_9HYPO|nr:hypothetical protein L249_4271 [Ophiocordyceps polyrhachis-furcata BCC 54312]
MGYVRVLQVGTLKYLEKIISISFSHLLNTNTSPASNSSSIASFRPSPQRLQRGRVRTYRGHSGRVIAVIAGVMGYVRVLQVGTLKYLEKIISISFSHLLNTNTSPASNSSSIASFRLSRDSSSSSLSPRVQLSDSGYLYTFNLFFTAFLFTFRPTNYLIRTVSSDAFQQSDPLFLKKISSFGYNGQRPEILFCQAFRLGQLYPLGTANGFPSY